MASKAKNILPAILIGSAVFCALFFSEWTAYGNQTDQNISNTCGHIDEANEAIESLQKERAKFLKWLNKLKIIASKLQSQPAGPARDYRLRSVMGEARELSGKLSELDKRIGSYRVKIGRLRARLRKIFEALEKQSSNKGDTAKKLRKCLAKANNMIEQKKVKSGKLSTAGLSPNDGPTEIRRKADLLEDSADKLGNRLKNLERSIARMEKQMALRKAIQRTEGRDQLWGTDSRRRVSVRVKQSPGVRGVVENNDDSRNLETSGGRDGVLTGEEESFNGSGGADDPSNVNPGSTVTPAAVSIRRVWNTTIRAVQDLAGKEVALRMQKDFMSGTPGSRLLTLKKARKLLQEKRAALKKKSKEYRKTATAIEKKARTRKTPKAR